MGAENSYLKDNFKIIFRKSILDITIYAFMSGQLRLLPSLSINEAARSFMTYADIREEEFSVESITQSYLRTRKQLIDEQRQTGESSPFFGKKGL